MCEKTFNALTEKVVESLSDISAKQQDHVIYELEQGSAITFTLLRNNNVHVIHAFLSSGTIFPLHKHIESAETIILESGNITVVCDEPGHEALTHKLRPGVPLWIPESMNHFLHAKEDSWVVAILIPPDKELL